MKKVLLTILLMFFMPLFCLAEGENLQPVHTPAQVVQKITFENCTKIFKVNQEKLFYLTLASISANCFSVDEIQSANGYIIFSANRNKYIATVAKIDNSNAILKITPCNNIYNFPPSIVTNLFRYIDLNQKNGINI